MKQLTLLVAGALLALVGAARAENCAPSDVVVRVEMARPIVSVTTSLGMDGLNALNRDYQRRFAAERAKTGTLERLGDNAVYPFEPRIGALTVTTPLIRIAVSEGDAVRIAGGFCRPVRSIVARIGWQTRLRWVARGVANEKCVGGEVTRDLREFAQREDKALEQVSAQISTELTALARKLALEPRANDATGRLTSPLQDLANQRYADVKAGLAADYLDMARKLSGRLRTICGGAARNLLKGESESDT